MKQKISREALIERMIGEFRKARPTSKIKEKDFGLEIALDDNGISMACSFNSLFDEINSGHNMDAAIKNRVEVFMQNADKLAGLSKNGWPRITKKLLREHGVYLAKDKIFLANAKSNAPKEKPQMVVTKEMTPEISKCAAIDHERYQMFLSTEMIKHLDIEEVHKIVQEATDNKKLKIWSTDEDLQGNPVKLLEATQVSTLVCSPKQLLEFTKGERHMAVLPFRDFMVISKIKKLGQKEQLEHELRVFMALYNLGKNIMDDKARPYPISEKPFVIDTNGVVMPYKHPLLKDGVMMAVSVNKETGEKKVEGMIKL